MLYFYKKIIISEYLYFNGILIELKFFNIESNIKSLFMNKYNNKLLYCIKSIFSCKGISQLIFEYRFLRFLKA